MTESAQWGGFSEQEKEEEKNYTVVELVGWGSVINKALPVFLTQKLRGYKLIIFFYV